MKETKQLKAWKGEFGKKYTLRNPLNIKDIDKLYLQNFGVSRTKLNKEFLGSLSRSMKILEVGANVGIQLMFLQRMGFKNLYGIEINKEAIKLSKSMTKNIYLIYGSTLDIPFKDNYFDLIFTSGLLIHISPFEIKDAMREICKVTKNYIWGFEYYADNYTEIIYRGKKDILWKTNFPKLYLDNFKNLKLVQERKLKYWNNENVNTMFLLKKR